MFAESNAVQKEYIGFFRFFIEKKINVKKICITSLAVLIILLGLFFAAKVVSGNDYSKDMNVADFRTDMNKLWEASRIIESQRITDSNLALNEFGTTGKLLNANEINPNLKHALIKLADFNRDNELSGDEVGQLGIMGVNEDLYNTELKEMQLSGLTIDRNLRHYVVITKGKLAGTVLYNGGLKFIDSNKRWYFGVELFDQL